MTTELNVFKQLIANIIQEKDTTNSLNKLQTEAEQLPDLISTGIFSLSSDYHIRNHICLAQNIITLQSDQLYRQLKNKASLSEKKALVITLGLLNAIGDRFPEHWDSINPIPNALYDKLTRQYQLLPEKLRGKLDRYGINSELIEIVLYPLQKFLTTKNPSTYGQQRYLEKYLHTLKELNFRGKSPSSAEALLCSRLITINYNELLFLDYLVGKRASELKTVYTKPEKFRILNKMRSRLRSVGVKEGMAFDKDYSLLKDAINLWIDGKEQEIRQSRERFKPAVTDTKARQKVFVSAGVLAFMARVCKIVGIYPESTRTQLITHMIETYTSKKVEIITKTSFTNLWKKPSIPVARELRRLLNLMLAEIQLYLDTGRLSDQPDAEKAT